ncbi:hypothetical protein KAU45_06635 [bacterium]|nr:hypothetical protein [bacterium]
MGILAFDTGKFPQAAAYLTSASEVFNTIDASPQEVERIATLLDKTIKVIKEKKLDLIVFTPDNPPELE